MPRLRALALSAVLFAALAACGGASSVGTADTGDSLPATATASVQTVSGGQFDLGDLEGQDTILWFWAPW